ncbi:hypothetical protein CRM22_010683 [Opisthorchis felineus]|uniref:Tetraspanin n=1 Tax=Opisthorchis felineus TaxID=147828 RepID=A0A4S2KQM4_OPIFE|nr:hypothetical protein CRM22_010683 [Opisthorchis felineus]
MSQEARRCMVHTMRIFLVVYNAIFLLTGIGLAAVGFLMSTQYKGYTNSLGPDLSIIPMLLAVLGIMIILASSLGIFGALLSHSCLLVCYSGILLLLLLGEIALGCAAFTEQDKVEHKAEVGIVQIMAQYMKTNETRFGVDYVQRKFKCCGVTGYRDWQHVLGSTLVPESCCSDPEHCVRQYEDIPNGSVPPGVQARGCLIAITSWIRGNSSIVIITVLSCGTLQLLGIVFGFLLAHRLRSSGQKVQGAG